MRPIEILLVEDNPGDVRLTREAMTESRIANNLNVVGDGAAALDFLERKGEYANAPVPDLVLLDLNLPKVSGHDVLESIKRNEALKTIPVVALTTSHARADIEQCYKNHVNCYITKPMSYGPFMDVVRSIEDFWLTRVELPRAERKEWDIGM
jgi:chemotaxis family two-component system response regulator Rcp1